MPHHYPLYAKLKMNFPIISEQWANNLARTYSDATFFKYFELIWVNYRLLGPG